MDVKLLFLKCVTAFAIFTTVLDLAATSSAINIRGFAIEQNPLARCSFFLFGELPTFVIFVGTSFFLILILVYVAEKNLKQLEKQDKYNFLYFLAFSIMFAFIITIGVEHTVGFLSGWVSMKVNFGTETIVNSISGCANI